MRTHGSRHEAAVPILIHGRKVDLARYRYNFDLARYLEFERD